MSKPLVSIIIPTYNEEHNIESCLDSIKRQDMHKRDIEVVIVDDGSIDKTLIIAKRFHSRIFHSGFHHIERSKSIGIEHAKGTYLFFIDADITLVNKDIISAAIESLVQNTEAVGTQCFYWKYSRHHSLINRYCELFGVNDPFPFYLNKRGIRSYLDRGWIYPDTLLKETTDYYLVRFTKGNLPTLGSQGYLCRADAIRKYTHWKPYYFHLDANADLVENGQRTFVMLKREVVHNYAATVYDFYRKLARNLMLFYQFRAFRTYDYDIQSIGFIFTIFVMVTVIKPLIDSIRGYIRIHDIAWFLHPLFCLTVPLLYAGITVMREVKKINKTLSYHAHK